MPHGLTRGRVSRGQAVRRAAGTLTRMAVLVQFAATGLTSPARSASAVAADALAAPAAAASPSVPAQAGESRSTLSPERRMGRYRHYAPCLGIEPVRLRGRHGFRVVPRFAEARTEGIYYVAAASDAAASDPERLLRWVDVREVEIWDYRKLPAMAEGWEIGVSIGCLATMPLALLPGDRRPSLGVMLAIPAMTGLIGAIHAGSKPGRWVYCEERGK